jgi:hypothetical protein
LIYLEALTDIPEHLLAVAVKHCIATNPYFPKPAELRVAVRDELAEWRRLQDEARYPKLPEPPPAPPPTEEDIAAVDAMVALALANLRAM